MNSDLNSDIARTKRVALFNGWGLHLFALTMIGLGISGLASGDFASVWQQIPIDHLPGRAFFAYATAIVELAAGLGLLFRQSVAIASRILFVFLLLWLILLKAPGIVASPSIEVMWLGFGEIAVMVAGGWILFATYNANDRSTFLVGRNGIRSARVLFAIALPMIGLSHFFYADETAKFVPAWLPLRHGWAYLTGAGSPCRLCRHFDGRIRASSCCARSGDAGRHHRVGVDAVVDTRTRHADANNGIPHFIGDRLRRVGRRRFVSRHNVVGYTQLSLRVPGARANRADQRSADCKSRRENEGIAQKPSLSRLPGVARSLL